MLAKNAPLQRTYLRQILTYLATYAVMYGSSQWMEQSKGLRPSTVGLVLVGMSLLLGFMNGFSGFGNQATLYLQAPAGDIAVASGLLRTSTYIGAIFSSSLIGITFGPAATDAGFHTLAWGLVGIGLVVLILTALDRSIPTVAK